MTGQLKQGFRARNLVGGSEHLHDAVKTEGNFREIGEIGKLEIMA
ncbi:hypothetical protein BROC_00991 [Candidatus Brocadiaceae bacterium]|nr:hypothetical protein BROC_00991 [Candidatus Brocadiaceae bacterium]